MGPGELRPTRQSPIPAATLAAAGLIASAAASGSPQGAEWETLDKPDGCMSCHLALPGGNSTESAGLVIEGLPTAVVPGRRYDLTIVLRDPELLIGGFLLGITSTSAGAGVAAGPDAGVLEAADDHSEAMGARARSTRTGALPTTPGELRWTLVWTAPSPLAAPVRFDLWGNAGNDDLSPLGDRIHHISLELPAAD